jgi:hypothetical protein
VTPDQSGDRAPEQANFAATRVTRIRRRPSLLTAGWVVLLGGIVALGLTGRMEESGGTRPAAEAAAAANADEDARASGGPSYGGPRRPGVELSKRFDPAFPGLVVVEAGETASLAIRATRNPSTVAIHGDVLAQEATAVVFMLQALDGQVARSVALNVSALLADGRNHRPSWPMDVELAIPTAMAASAFIVEADVYGSSGRRIDRIRLRLAPEM